MTLSGLDRRALGVGCGDVGCEESYPLLLDGGSLVRGEDGHSRHDASLVLPVGVRAVRPLRILEDRLPPPVYAKPLDLLPDGHVTTCPDPDRQPRVRDPPLPLAPIAAEP